MSPSRPPRSARTLTIRWMSAGVLALLALGAVALGSATGVLGCAAMPPPTHVLTVRNLEAKCALIAFSHCPRPEPDPEAAFDEDDAGALEDAGVAADAALD